MKSRKNDRRGLTLMEMILVMALMVMIASLTAPAFRRPLENHRLRRSGDVVRIAFTRARIRAMRSGQTHAFRYQVGGAGYVTELWRADDAYLEAGTEVDVDQTSPLAGGGGSPSRSNANLASDPNDEIDLLGQGVQEELPEGTTFLGALIESDMRGVILQQDSGDNGALALQSEWSPPILFYPDGTTSDAKLILVNRNQRFVRVNLRGLTGIAQVSDLLDQTELELPQQ